MNAKRMPSMPAVPRPTVAVARRFASRFTNRLGAVVVAGAFLVVASVQADWLKLRSGDVVETRGAWKVEGPKVIFTTTRGTLSSVRATEVDVDASHALTTKKHEEATKGVATPVPTPKRPPVLVLTDKDFAKEPTPDAAAAASAEDAVDGEAPVGEGEAPPEGAAGESSGAQASAPQASAARAPVTGSVAATGGAAAAGGATTGGTAAAAGSAPAKATASQRAAAPQRGVAVPRRPVVVPSADSLETRVGHMMPGAPALRVASWSARPTGDDQLSIFGEVVNGGSRVTAAINVAVKLIDSEGVNVGSTEALVSSTALMPNAQADFEAKFPSETNFAEVQFTLKTVELEIGPPADGEELDEPVGDEPHATAKTVAKPRS